MPSRPRFLPPPKERRVERSGFVYPGPRDRVTLNGMTGAGKSTFAMWLFAEAADFNKKPWIFLDYKKEQLIQSLLAEDMAEPLSLRSSIPKEPGIFVVTPDAQKDGQGAVAEFLWKIYHAGKTGLFLDEATMVPELRGEANSGGPFQSILSQGRSKEIPCWVLAQRPAFVNNMVYTENNYYCAFRLRSPKDLAKVVDNIPVDSPGFKTTWGEDVKLKPHYSRWYDAQQDRSWILKPSPPPDAILDRIYARVDSARKRESL